MTGQAKGKAFGREMVRAMSEPWDGQILTGRGTASGDNKYLNLAQGCVPARAAAVPIKGVAVKADSTNSGSIYVVGIGEDGNPGLGDQGFELAAGDPISLATDDLGKVNVFIPTSGDKVRYCAIAAAGSIEP